MIASNTLFLLQWINLFICHICTIPVQLQAEVCKCLDTWLKQGIIRPSQSPYVSQVVIVHKKIGEIWLCIDFCALNAITVCVILFLCRMNRESTASCKSFRAVHLIWPSLRGIYSWLWIRQTFIKLLSTCRFLRSCTSLLVCPLDFLMLVLVFVALWKCAWVTNNI